MKSVTWLRTAMLAFSMSCAGAALADPPPLATYGGLPGIEDMSISPSGQGIAIVGRVNRERRLVVLDAKREVRANAPLGDTKLEYVRWVGEDMVIVVTHATQNLGPGFTTDKAEFDGAIVVPVDGSKPQMVFAATPSLAHAIFGDYGTRLIDGKWLGYFGGLELTRSADGISYDAQNSKQALFSVDLKTNHTHKVAYAASESGWRGWLVDGVGNVAATLGLNTATGRWQLTNQQGAMLASGTDLQGNIGLLGFGRDGSTAIYWSEDKTTGAKHWFEVPLAGGTAKEILADVHIKRIYVDPTNDRMLGYLQDGAPPTPVMFDQAQEAAVRKVYRAFPKSHLEIVEFTPDFKYFLVHTSGTGDSGSWYVVDMAKLRADPVGSDYPLVPPEQVGPVSMVTYHAIDGMEMDGVLTQPPGGQAKNLPVVMMPHGGPTAHDEAEFDWWAQAFASRGYAVFQPNFRGSTDRDAAFQHAGDGEWGRKMQTDISDGLAELAKQGIVDPKRACIVGASYGGYAALAGVTLQQGLYRCAVAVAPVSDLGDMYWTDFHESGDDVMLRRDLDASLGNMSRFAAVSPRKHAAQANAPILLIHGKDDTVVSFKQSQAMADALKNAGKPYEMVVMPNEDHWLSHAATRQQMLEAAVRFVNQYNPAN